MAPLPGSFCLGWVAVGPRVCRLATYPTGIDVDGVLAVAPLRLRPLPSHSLQVGMLCRSIPLPLSLSETESK